MGLHVYLTEHLGTAGIAESVFYGTTSSPAPLAPEEHTRAVIPEPITRFWHRELLYPEVGQDSLKAVAAVEASYENCGTCHLSSRRTRISFIKGNPLAACVFLGEGPGHAEDIQGVPFVGPAGRLQDKLCLEQGIEPLVDLCWLNMVGCFVGGTEVSSPQIERGYRRHYEGLLVEVCAEGSSNGTDARKRRRLTGTPNHPVLTQRGWVPLGSLVEGDDLIGCVLREGMGIRDPHVEHEPSTFDDLLRALALDGVRERMPGTYMDFHGDGSNTQIDVVAQHGLLGDRVQSPIRQHISKLVLERPHHASGDLLLVRPDSRELVGQLWVSRLSPQGGVGLLCQRLTPVGADPLQAQAQGFGTSAKLDPSGLQPLSEVAVRDAERVRERLCSLASKVTTHRVVDVERRWFRGHVYNLQTVEGWYTANGIVASNCRPCSNHWTDDRPPKLVEKLACSERTLMLLRAIRPRVVVCLGAEPTSMFWDAAPDPWTWHTFYPPALNGDWIAVGYARHPAYLLRTLPVQGGARELHASRRFLGELKTRLAGLGKLPLWPLPFQYLREAGRVVTET